MLNNCPKAYLCFSTFYTDQNITVIAIFSMANVIFLRSNNLVPRAFPFLSLGSLVPRPLSSPIARFCILMR
jgi:hypothetical protein